MLEVAENPRAVIGGNQPPKAEPTPYEAMKTHIEDLYEEALGFLDGEPITTQAQADAVDRLKAMALEAEKDGDEKRKVEAKPFDDGKKEVQERWNPLVHKETGKCRQIITTCNKALTPFLLAEQKKLDDAAAEKSKLAADVAEAARAAHAAAAPDDLGATAKAEELLREATAVARDAKQAGSTRALASGGGRKSSGLVSYWITTLTDRRIALNHFMVTQPEALAAWLIEQAEKDVASGVRAIPGFTITEDKRAR